MCWIFCSENYLFNERFNMGHKTVRQTQLRLNALKLTHTLHAHDHDGYVCMCHKYCVLLARG